MSLPATLGALDKFLRNALKPVAGETAETESRLIIKKRNGLDWSSIIADPDKPVENLKAIEEDLNRRLKGEPLSRIYGEKEFYGRNFKISPDTLDPRPDTEILVDIALKLFHMKQKPAEILDLGAGTGAILVTLLREMPHSCGFGIDLSLEALRICLHNAILLGVTDRAGWICGDWADSVNRQFDLIVSNPPYIRSDVIPNLDSEVRNHDPILALDGGADGLEAYKKIFSDLPRLLKKGGIALLEIGYDQEEEILRLGEKYRIRIEGVHRDIAGRPRVVHISCGDK